MHRVQRAIVSELEIIDTAAEHLDDETTSERFVESELSATEQMRLLYQCARHALSYFRAAVDEISKGVPGMYVKHAALKRKDRAAAKACDKYRGQFRYVLDIVRSTIVCSTLRVLLGVIQAIEQHPGLEILRIKNRLNPAFSADSSAGYRDILLNVRVSTGHICELQVTLEAFLHIKDNEGGHEAYNLSRLCGMDDPEQMQHCGGLTKSAAHEVASGVLQKLYVEGTDVCETGRAMLPQSLATRTTYVFLENGVKRLPCRLACVRQGGLKVMAPPIDTAGGSSKC